MRAGMNAGIYSTGGKLPKRLEALISRTGRGYADGGVVPSGLDEFIRAPRGYADGGSVPPQPGVSMGAVQAATQGPPPGVATGPMPGAQLQGAVKQAIAANPQATQQLKQAIDQAIQSGQMTADQLNLIIETAKAVVQNPALYPRLRQMLIQNGIATEQEIPPQYDQGIIFAFLMMAEAVQGQAQGEPQAPVARMADGGSIPVSASPTDSKSGRADDVPIRVSGGEFVIPKHVVAAKGTEYFERMLEQYDPNNPESKVNQKK